jgi:subtilisin family serine protease
MQLKEDLKAMAGRRLFVVSLLVFTLFTAQAQAATSIPVIIKIKPLASLLQVLDALSGTLIDNIPGTRIYLVNVPEVPLIQPILGLLGNTLGLLGLEWLEVNNGISEPSHSQLGILDTSGNTSPDWYRNQPAMTLIRADQARPYSTGRGIVIADINSQVDYSHPALIGHLTSGRDFVTNRPPGSAAVNSSTASFLDQSQAGVLDQASTAFIHQSYAGFLDDPDTQNPAYSHGTLTAGVIAAIAPDSMIMPLRAFDDNGSADTFILSKAIRHAVDNGAQIINMSFGTLEKSKAMQEMVDYAKSRGVLLVASAGNNNTSAVQYPAAFSGVMGTAATQLSDVKASFSNYGSYIFVDAPGVNIISAYPGGRYAVVSGTSFSAPAVAATAALVRSVRTYGVTNSISGAAIDIDWKNPMYRDKLGYGRIDVLRSVRP